jgi:NACalpha-BTF3-like transcription factor
MVSDYNLIASPNTIHKDDMNKAVRAIIQISGIEVEVFKVASNGDDNDYVISQSQVAKAIDTNEANVRYFLSSKATKESGLSTREKSSEKQLGTSQGKGYRDHKIDFDNEKAGRRGGNSHIKPLPINLASEFWATQAFKGNTKAQSLVYACVLESFKRRCDNAFGIPKTTDEYEEESIVDRQTWMESRNFLKDAHASFTNCCLYNGFNAAVAHDEITMSVCGKTAKELRLDDLVDGCPRVGLNHVINTDDLVTIAKVKLAFSRYKVGTVKQRVKRAVEAVSQ